MKLARARQLLEAVVAHDFEAAEELLDPDAETVTALPSQVDSGSQAD